jgi:hypothetical protein
VIFALHPEDYPLVSLTGRLCRYILTRRRERHPSWIAAPYYDAVKMVSPPPSDRCPIAGGLKLRATPGCRTVGTIGGAPARRGCEMARLRRVALPGGPALRGAVLVKGDVLHPGAAARPKPCAPGAKTSAQHAAHVSVAPSSTLTPRCAAARCYLTGEGRRDTCSL